MFNEPTEAKYVRLTGVETYGEGSQQNKFASAAEIRLRKADSKTDISDATVSLTNEKKLVSVVDKDHPVTLSKEDIEVTLGDKVLRYGIDYKLTYNNNEAPGTATAIVTGIGQYGYTGSQEVSFTIELKKPEMNNISINRAAYWVISGTSSASRAAASSFVMVDAERSSLTHTRSIFMPCRYR